MGARSTTRTVSDRSGVARSATSLVAARLAAQVVSFAWFLLAARLLPREELGVVGVGLAVLLVSSALGELGVNRTLTRHLAGGAPARPTLLAAVALRSVGAVVAVPLVAVAAWVAEVEAPLSVLAVALVLSWVSGTTDLTLAGLRAIGAVSVEARILVIERLAFVVVGGAAVLGGMGPTAVMVSYLFTNVASVTLAMAAWRARTAREPGSGAPMFDREARRTAAQGTVSLLVPRIAAVAIAAMGTASEVGGMSVIARPVEALTMLGVTALAVVHPEARRRVVAGLVGAERRLVARSGIALALGALVACVALWPVVGWVLDVIGGAGRYRDMAGPFVGLVGVLAVSFLRQAAEVSALAEERAGLALTAGAVALGGGLAVAVATVPDHGVLGAVGAQLTAEVLGLAVLAVGLSAARGGRGETLGRAESGRWRGDPRALVGAA